MKIGYIYKTTNLINNRIYVGKKYRSEFDPTYYGSGLVLQEAIEKYGKSNFSIELLCWAETEEEINQLERKYISEFKSSFNLYNIAEGGTGGDTTSNHPLKNEIISRRGQGIKKWHQSLTDSQKKERSKKISRSKKGKSNGHEGLSQKQETIEKIRQSNIEFNRSENAEWKKAHAEAMAKRRGKSLTKKYKSVLINDVHYESIKHAMAALGIKHRATFYDKLKRGILKVQYL